MDITGLGWPARGGGLARGGAGVATGLLCLGLQSGPGAETLDMMIASLVLGVFICLQGRSEGRVTVREPVLNFLKIENRGGGEGGWRERQRETERDTERDSTEKQ